MKNTFHPIVNNVNYSLRGMHERFTSLQALWIKLFGGIGSRSGILDE